MRSFTLAKGWVLQNKSWIAVNFDRREPQPFTFNAQMPANRVHYGRDLTPPIQFLSFCADCLLSSRWSSYWAIRTALLSASV